MTTKILIIIGSAPCQMKDVKAFLAICKSSLEGSILHFPHDHDIMAVGLDTAELPLHIDHVVTMHPYELPAFFERRRDKANLNLGYETHSQEQYDDWVDHVWPYNPPSGSSAMHGVEAGMAMGYEKIVLAGCPLSGRYDEFHRGWQVRYDKIKDAVRSMSGWTRELLGAPTEEWLNAA